MRIQICSRAQLETQSLPGPSALICMMDHGDVPTKILDAAQVRARLDLAFDDVGEACEGMRAPSDADARRILQFIEQHEREPNLVVACRLGRGPSESVLAALMKIHGNDPRPVLHGGTYNRLLYRLLLTAAGLPLEPEPLVSITVRLKYAPDRLRMFLLSMQRQRHQNWEVVAVSDGPNPGAAELVAELNDARVRLLETEKPRGHWGHPYRQIGLDACRGEFIGMSNDDNYYVPGYLEQMLHALEDADVVQCIMVHSYYAWGHLDYGTDLGCFLARTSLVRQVSWPGDHFSADVDFVDQLKALPGVRSTIVDRPLFIHN